MRCVGLLEPPHNGFLSDVANLLTYCGPFISHPPRKGGIIKIIYTSRIFIPPPPRYYPTLLLCTHCTYTSLFLITLTPHSFCHLSYEGFASFILIFAHCPIQTPILSDITLRCTPCCKSSSCSLLTPLRTRRNVKGYNGTRHKYYNPNYNR